MYISLKELKYSEIPLTVLSVALGLSEISSPEQNKTMVGFAKTLIFAIPNVLTANNCDALILEPLRNISDFFFVVRSSSSYIFIGSN